jgi:hypothetical protein
MVREWCSELFLDAYFWKCVNCGAIVDPVINQNQGVASPALRHVVARP